MRRLRFHLRCLLVALGLLAVQGLPARAADSAVILVYPRLAGGAAESGSVRMARLEAHLAELAGGSYRVLGLAEVVAALREGRPLPDRTVVLTFDDPNMVLYREAWPRLRAAGMPFAVFIAPHELGGSGGMGWAQLRELKAAGAAIGIKPTFLAPETPDQAMSDLARASDAYAAELGEKPKFLAWASGEASSRTMKAAADSGFVAGFGQHSGVAWAGQQPYFLPRFAITEDYADLERFRRVASALPLPISDLTPANPKLEQNPPPFGFTLVDDFPNLDQLACFSAHDGRMKMDVLGNRIEARMAKPFPPGRGRINCTLPNGDGRWRWFGYQWSVGR